MPHPNLLDPAKTALVVVDVQERLIPHILEGGQVVARCRRLMEAFRTLGLPILVTEQYVKGLGPTVPELREVLGSATVIEKREFSACGPEAFRHACKPHAQLLLCGVEAHVCVSQTAHDLLDLGHQVQVAADAVGSRHAENLHWGLAKMQQAGAIVTTTEAAIFELLRTSQHEHFKAVSALVR